MTSPVWHPFTQHGLEPNPPVIIKSEGVILYTQDGRQLLDAISSWWVTTHGHRHPTIMQAIRKACEDFDQIIFAGLTHPLAEELAQELIGLVPKGLGHVFFCDSGSTSVECAIKMALGYFKFRGEPRKKIIVMEHTYHGDTIGAMSLGQRGVFNAAYEPLLFAVERIPFPQVALCQTTLDCFEKLCQQCECAALIVEPLILGAGGMKIYGSEMLSELHRIAHHYGVLFIADEVLTGWGRTGTLFACEQGQITPDILCTSKGLTGGSLPLAATLASDEVFAAHCSTDRTRTFFHSSSYTANPIACAAALGNIKIWRDEPVHQRIDQLCQRQSQQLQRFVDHPRFANLRQIGTINALDFVGEDGYLADIGIKLRKFFMEGDILLRPLGNVIYIMPPYCIEADQLSTIYDRILAAADQA